MHTVNYPLENIVRHHSTCSKVSQMSRSKLVDSCIFAKQMECLLEIHVMGASGVVF